MLRAVGVYPGRPIRYRPSGRQPDRKINFRKSAANADFLLSRNFYFLVNFVIIRYFCVFGLKKLNTKATKKYEANKKTPKAYFITKKIGFNKN